MSGQESRLLGRWGEALAAEHLRRAGYQILAANWRSRFGEIDNVHSHCFPMLFRTVMSDTTS